MDSDRATVMATAMELAHSLHRQEQQPQWQRRQSTQMELKTKLNFFMLKSQFTIQTLDSQITNFGFIFFFRKPWLILCWKSNLELILFPWIGWSFIQIICAKHALQTQLYWIKFKIEFLTWTCSFAVIMIHGAPFDDNQFNYWFEKMMFRNVSNWLWMFW